MPSYILRTIPPALWARFKARSEADGIPMRALLLKLVELYADGAIRGVQGALILTPAPAAPPPPATPARTEGT